MRKRPVKRLASSLHGVWGKSRARFCNYRLVHGCGRSICCNAHDTAFELNVGPIAEGTCTSLTFMSCSTLAWSHAVSAMPPLCCAHLQDQPVDRHLALFKVYQVGHKRRGVVPPATGCPRCSISAVVSIQAPHNGLQIVAGDIACGLAVICRVDCRRLPLVSRSHRPAPRRTHEARSCASTRAISRWLSQRLSGRGME